jgi:hypothetical protein
MSPKESHMTYMEKLGSKSSRRLHSEKEVILGLKCGFLYKDSIQVVHRCTVSEEVKSVRIVRVREI